jgi:hypothetical protein
MSTQSGNFFGPGDSYLWIQNILAEDLLEAPQFRDDSRQINMIANFAAIPSRTKLRFFSLHRKVERLLA